MRDDAYVNGEFLPLGEARISVLDRGFLFADGVYEVAAVLDGRLVDWASHHARFERSLAELRLPHPAPGPRLLEIVRELVARNGVAEGLVYLQATRGAAPRDFAFPVNAAPTLVAFTQKKAILASPAAERGVAVLSLPDLRWARRDIKSVALLAQTLAKQAAVEAGCQEAWMLDAEGKVTEGSSSTAFIVTEGDAIVTRPNSTAILPGCTRLAVAACAQQQGLRVEERAFALSEAYAAREAFLTSASTFVTPIIAIDSRPVGEGRPGPVARRLRELYIDFAKAGSI
jgi:D-alanine transaminase